MTEKVKNKESPPSRARGIRDGGPMGQCKNLCDGYDTDSHDITSKLDITGHTPEFQGPGINPDA